MWNEFDRSALLAYLRDLRDIEKAPVLGWKGGLASAYAALYLRQRLRDMLGLLPLM